MSGLRLNERYADFGQVGFIAFMRIDGNLVDAGTHPIRKSAYGFVGFGVTGSNVAQHDTTLRKYPTRHRTIVGRVALMVECLSGRKTDGKAKVRRMGGSAEGERT
jgi:hypothetical protein